MSDINWDVEEFWLRQQPEQPTDENTEEGTE